MPDGVDNIFGNVTFAEGSENKVKINLLMNRIALNQKDQWSNASELIACKKQLQPQTGDQLKQGARQSYKAKYLIFCLGRPL